MTKKEYLKQAFAELLKREKVKVNKWNRTSHGEADIAKRCIATPRPTSVYRFMVGLHEVCHVVHKLDYRVDSVAMCEYKTEKKTIALAKKYSIDSLYPEEFKHYILTTKAQMWEYCEEAKQYPKQILNWLVQTPTESSISKKAKKKL